MKLNTEMWLGFMLNHDHFYLGPNPGAFGHGGAGGSLSFADPDARVGFAFVMNKMHDGLVTGENASKLTDVLYSCL